LIFHKTSVIIIDLQECVKLCLRRAKYLKVPQIRLHAEKMCLQKCCVWMNRTCISCCGFKNLFPKHKCISLNISHLSATTTKSILLAIMRRIAAFLRRMNLYLIISLFSFYIIHCIFSILSNKPYSLKYISLFIIVKWCFREHTFCISGRPK